MSKVESGDYSRDSLFTLAEGLSVLECLSRGYLQPGATLPTPGEKHAVYVKCEKSLEGRRLVLLCLLMLMT